MNAHVTFALIALVCGIGGLLTSRSAARTQAAGLATHKLRKNRSRWLDPVFSETQILVGLRVIAALFVFIGMATGVRGFIG